MIGAVVSVAAAVVVEAHIEVAGRQTVKVEHLRQQEQTVFAAYMSSWATYFLLVHWQVQRSMTFDGERYKAQMTATKWNMGTVVSDTWGEK